jgi:hypothetical protein
MTIDRQLESGATRGPPSAVETAEFELYVNDELVATASGPIDRALSEILHYQSVYAQDSGKPEIWKIDRTRISMADIFRYSLGVAKEAIDANKT